MFMLPMHALGQDSEPSAVDQLITSNGFGTTL
jgi:hypothetical protein